MRSISTSRPGRRPSRQFYPPRLVVLGAAGPTVSALAGMSGMRLSTYLTLATLGLGVRLWIWIQFADVLRRPIEQLLAWIDECWVPGTIVLVAIIGVAQWRSVRAMRAAPAGLRGTAQLHG